MYKNLKKEMRDAGYTRRNVAQACGITERVLLYKLKGSSPFKSSEMFLIKEKFFPDKTLEYLFKNETDTEA